MGEWDCREGGYLRTTSSLGTSGFSRVGKWLKNSPQKGIWFRNIYLICAIPKKYSRKYIKRRQRKPFNNLFIFFQAKTIPFDVNFMNFEDPDVFKRMTGPDYQKYWKETYGYDWVNQEKLVGMFGNQL
jgi:hypothetical protein